MQLEQCSLRRVGVAGGVVDLLLGEVRAPVAALHRHRDITILSVDFVLVMTVLPKTMIKQREVLLWLAIEPIN